MTDLRNIPCYACDYDPSVQIIGSWFLELPIEGISGNALRTNTRSGFKYRRYRDQVMAAIQAECGHIPAATRRRRVFFTRYYASPKRALDSDNLAAGFKPTRDCLTRLGLIVDDKDQYLQAHYRQVKTDRNYVTIEIEEILGW